MAQHAIYRLLTINPAKFAYRSASFILVETPMPVSGLPILSMLKSRMQWHQERQRLLSENIANADTPNFRPTDLSPLKFDSRAPSAPAVAMQRTSAAHMSALMGGTSRFDQARDHVFETKPAGNAVSLEDEMLKVAANQMDYQAATSLYSKSLGLVKTALGKR
jgi:flagellar basal-body rod protein FlgB